MGDELHQNTQSVSEQSKLISKVQDAKVPLNCTLDQFGQIVSELLLDWSAINGNRVEHPAGFYYALLKALPDVDQGKMGLLRNWVAEKMADNDGLLTNPSVFVERLVTRAEVIGLSKGAGSVNVTGNGGTNNCKYCVSWLCTNGSAKNTCLCFNPRLPRPKNVSDAKWQFVELCRKYIAMTSGTSSLKGLSFGKIYKTVKDKQDKGSAGDSSGGAKTGQVNAIAGGDKQGAATKGDGKAALVLSESMAGDITSPNDFDAFIDSLSILKSDGVQVTTRSGNGAERDRLCHACGGQHAPWFICPPRVGLPVRPPSPDSVCPYGRSQCERGLCHCERRRWQSLLDARTDELVLWRDEFLKRELDASPYPRLDANQEVVHIGHNYMLLGAPLYVPAAAAPAGVVQVITRSGGGAEPVCLHCKGCHDFHFICPEMVGMESEYPEPWDVCPHQRPECDLYCDCHIHDYDRDLNMRRFAMQCVRDFKIAHELSTVKPDQRLRLTHPSSLFDGHVVSCITKDCRSSVQPTAQATASATVIQVSGTFDATIKTHMTQDNRALERPQDLLSASSSREVATEEAWPAKCCCTVCGHSEQTGCLNYAIAGSSFCFECKTGRSCQCICDDYDPSFGDYSDSDERSSSDINTVVDLERQEIPLRDVQPSSADVLLQEVLNDGNSHEMNLLVARVVGTAESIAKSELHPRWHTYLACADAFASLAKREESRLKERLAKIKQAKERLHGSRSAVSQPPTEPSSLSYPHLSSTVGGDWTSHFISDTPAEWLTGYSASACNAVQVLTRSGGGGDLPCYACGGIHSALFICPQMVDMPVPAPSSQRCCPYNKSHCASQSKCGCNYEMWETEYERRVQELAEQRCIYLARELELPTESTESHLANQILCHAIQGDAVHCVTRRGGEDLSTIEEVEEGVDHDAHDKSYVPFKASVDERLAVMEEKQNKLFVCC